MSETQSYPVLDALSALLIDQAARTKPLLVGVTGSVAVGKSTFARQLSETLAGQVRLEALSTDGFLLPNAELDRQGLTLRKGFPESYDQARLFAALVEVRERPTAFPVYSHTSYDVDPALTRLVDRPDILILEGLAFAPFSNGRSLADAVDLLIYLDATEEHLEGWFVERFMAFWQAAEYDPASFYHQFRSMDVEGATQFARMVWAQINLPNLRDHICLARDKAHIVLRKARDHSLDWTKGPVITVS